MMGAMAGFIVGYVLGAREGPEGYEKIRKAWQSILEAPEVKGLLEQAPKLSDLVASVAAGGGSGVADQIKGLVDRSDGLSGAFKTLAESEAVQSMLSTGLALARGVVEKGLGFLQSQRQSSE